MNYREQVLADRRAAARERAAGISEGIQVKIAPAKIEVGPLFQEAASFKVTRLAGGLKASLRAEKAAATRRRRKYSA